MKSNFLWGALFSLASVVLTSPRSYAQTGYKPLTTTDLRSLALREGVCYQSLPLVQFNRCVGLAFQRTVIELIFRKSQNTLPVLSPLRAALTSANSNRVVSVVIPDAIFDFTDEKTKIVYPEGGYTEVKAVKGTLRLSSSNYQIAGLLDIATRLKIVPLGGTPALTFITTADTDIGSDVIAKAASRSPVVVALYQYKAYIDNYNRVCLIEPIPLGTKQTNYKEDYTKARCNFLTSGYLEAPIDPDPITVE